MFVIPRLMIVTRNNEFSIRLKQALEQAGKFEVTSFTSINAALDDLQVQPRDVLMLDVTLDGVQPSRVIRFLRETWPDTAIVAIPDNPAISQLAQRLNLNGVVDYEDSVRQILPVLEDARQQMYEAQPDTTEAPAVVDEDTAVIDEPNMQAILDAQRKASSGSMDLIFSDEDDGRTTIHFTSQDSTSESSVFQDSDDALEIFNRLAAEEPPMPGVEEGGTVSDLMHNIASGDFRQFVNREFRLSEEHTPAVPGEPVEDSRAIPAVLILEDATDESTPLDNFSVEQFLTRIQTQMQDAGMDIKPLPSWIGEGDKYVREPEFLTEEIKNALYPSQPLEYTSPTTTPTDAQLFDLDPGTLTTDVNVPFVPDTPEPLAVDSPEDVVPDSLWKAPTDIPELPEPDVNNIIENPLPDEDLPSVKPFSTVEPVDTLIDAEEADVVEDISEEIAAESEITEVPEDLSYTARLALALTQVSLESTAEAIVLIHEGEIIAHAGELQRDDIESIREQVEGEWEAAPEQGRIRFLTMPGTGMDFMLYSRGLADDLTLSLIFSGTKPLHAIRRQGKRMAEALIVVPESDTIEHIAEDDSDVADSQAEIIRTQIEIEPVVDAGVLIPVTFTLALRDPDDVMEAAIRNMLETGMKQQLARRGWKIHTLEVDEDTIYLFVDAPESDESPEHLATLKSIATEIIQQQFSAINDRLWADACMVLRPGREITNEERQDFLHFLRM